MTATYTVAATAVALPTTAANTTLIALWNPSPTKKLYITRAWILNSGTTVVTGVLQNLTLSRFTLNQVTGTLLVPVKHDTASATLVSGTDYNSTTKPTVAMVAIDTFRFMTWDTDEFINNVSKLSNMTAFPMFGEFWNSGYADTNVQPLIVNFGEGICINSAGIASGTGTVDVYFEFYQI